MHVASRSPANLITSKNPVTNPISSGFYKADNSTPPRGGFTAQGACVTRPGWGVVNNVPTPCPVGSWSAGDSGDPCTACGFGLTTGANSTQASAAECGIAPGFGWLRNSVAPCPVGEDCGVGMGVGVGVTSGVWFVDARHQHALAVTVPI